VGFSGLLKANAEDMQSNPLKRLRSFILEGKNRVLQPSGWGIFCRTSNGIWTFSTVTASLHSDPGACPWKEGGNTEQPNKPALQNPGVSCKAGGLQRRSLLARYTSFDLRLSTIAGTCYMTQSGTNLHLPKTD
jgi:hypothetical protein